MKRKTRGRKTRLGRALTKRICTLLAKGATIKSAAIQCGVSEKSYHNWIERGKASESPYEEFFLTATRARERWRQRLLEKITEAADRDAKHAEWLLERQFPREFAPSDRRPIPREEPTSSVKFVAALPSGATADVDEIWKVARQFHEAAQPREPIKNEPTPENEPMTHWYNPVTRCIERRESLDNGEHEDA